MCKIEPLRGTLGSRRYFFLIDTEAALTQKKVPRRKKALRLVNAASPRTISIDKKKISSGTQGTKKRGTFYLRFNYICYKDQLGYLIIERRSNKLMVNRQLFNHGQINRKEHMGRRSNNDFYYMKSYTYDLKSGFIISNHKLMM